MVAHRVLAASLAVLLSYCQAPIHPNKTTTPHRSKTTITTSTKNLKKTGPKAKLSPQAIKYIQAVQRAQLQAFFQALWIARWTSAPQYVHDTMACIRSYESGNPAESSHPESGSGSYQFTPPTWRHYFGAWADASGYAEWAKVMGLPETYAYAFQAPGWVQDGVTIFALMNGGAHNWDMAYGNDPCTEGWT